MAWINLALVTNRKGSSPYQVRISCEGSDTELVQRIIASIGGHLHTLYGNYTGEEYAALTATQKARPVDMDSVG